MKVMRCALCNMRCHRCLCKSRRRKTEAAVDDLPKVRPSGQSTITMQCSPVEQLAHWSQYENRNQSSQDRRQSAKGD